MSASLLFCFKVENKMNEKNYEKKIELKDKMISRQLEQINNLKAQVEALKLEREKQNELINSVSILKDELAKNVDDVKRYKDEYSKLIAELRKMKKIMNQDVYKGKWWLIKLLIK